MSGSKVVIQLYRSLLRLGRRFDRFPSSKGLVFRRNTFTDDQSNDGSLSRYYNQIISKVFLSDTAIFLSPSKYRSEGREYSFQSIIQREFRYSNEICGFNTLQRIDVSFIFLKKMSSLWNSYKHSVDADTIAISTAARSVVEKKQLNVNLSSSLSPGLILVSHPLLPGCLHRSVILLLEHSSKGSYGVIINRHFPSKISAAVKNLPPSFLKIFGNNHVYFGGRERRFQVIHDVADCGGIPVPNCSKALFAGGNIGKLVNYCEMNGKENRSRFHFYAGCCYWVNDDLSKEIDARCWTPVSAIPNELLDIEWTQTSNLANDTSTGDFCGPLDSASGSLLDPQEEIDISDSKKGDLWLKVMEALGPNFDSYGYLPTWPDINNVESMDFQ
jgi:putative AlgH/UPF0301 family transcriptional regulator